MKVSRWLPGIMDEITEHSAHGVKTVNIAERLALEAKVTLDKNEQLASKKDELLTRMESGRMESVEQTDTLSALPTSSKRVRIKNLSNPSGEMFGIAAGTEGIFQPTAPISRRRRTRALSTPIAGNMWGDNTTVVLGPGEILVDIIGPDGKKHPAKMKQETFKQVSGGGNPVMLTVEEADKQFVGKYLDGFVRKQGRTRSVSSKSIDDIMHA